MESKPPRKTSDNVFLTYFDLDARGIPYSRVHLSRMMREGAFPTAVRLSPNRIAWRLSEIEAWMDSRPRAVTAKP